MKILRDVTKNKFVGYYPTPDKIGITVYAKSSNYDNTRIDIIESILSDNKLALKVKDSNQYVTFNSSPNEGPLTTSGIQYNFNVKMYEKYSIGTTKKKYFTIHSDDRENFFTVYYDDGEQKYKMDEARYIKPSYFEIFDTDNGEANIWMLTRNQVVTVGKDACYTKCGKNDDTWDCKNNTKTATAFCNAYNYGVKCENGQMELGGYNKCSTGDGTCNPCIKAINRPEVCTKIGDIKAQQGIFNTPPEEVYMLSNKFTNSGNVPLLCEYDYNSVLGSLDGQQLYKIKNDFGTPEEANAAQSSRVNTNYQTPKQIIDRIGKDWCSQIVGPFYDDGQQSYYKNNTTLRLMKDPYFCQPWCSDNPTECTPLIKDYCKGENLLDPYCQTFCKDNDCDNVLQEFCTNKDYTDEKYGKICPCFQSSTFYNNYYDGLKKKFKFGIPNFIPECTFPRCAAADIKRSIYRNTNCPDIIQCIQNVEVNNDGTIGKLDINITGDCQKFYNNCTGNQIVEGSGCKTCPPGQIPNGDRTVCIDKPNCRNDEYVDTNGNCQTCTGGKIVNATKTGCVCGNNQIIDSSGNCQTCPSDKIPNYNKSQCIDNLNKYSCKFVTGKCEESIDGKYDNQQDCEKKCRIKRMLFISGIIIFLFIIIAIGIFIIKKSK